MVRTLLMSRAAASSSELSSSRASNSWWKQARLLSVAERMAMGGASVWMCWNWCFWPSCSNSLRVEAEAELVEFLLAGQATEDQQPGDLDEIGVLGELLDGNPSIAENALVPVDEGDSALADAGIAQRGVVGNQAGLVAEAGDVDGPLALGAHEDG